MGAPPSFLAMAAEWGSPALSRSPGAVAITSATCLPGPPLCGFAMGALPSFLRPGQPGAFAVTRRFGDHLGHLLLLWGSAMGVLPSFIVMPADRGSPATSRSPGVLAATPVTFRAAHSFAVSRSGGNTRRAGAAGSAPGAGQALALRRASVAVCLPRERSAQPTR